MKKLYSLFLSAFLLPSGLFAQHSWSGFGQLNATVKTIAADTGKSFYIGGTFTKIDDDTMEGIARFSNGKFSLLGQHGISNGCVATMITFNGGLVAGGKLSQIDTTSCNNIGFWDGLKWNPMGDGLDYTGATTVSTLTIYGGDLYAGGKFNTSGGTTLNNIAKWDGSEWVSLGSGVNGTVNALCVYNGDLYVAGTFTSAGGVTVHNIARWDGSDWYDVSGGLDYTGATTVSTLHVYNGNLYAGGIFSSAGGNSANLIAKWNGTSWSDVGGGLDYTGATTVSTLTISDFDGKLIAEAKYVSNLDSNDVTYRMQYWNDTAWSMMDATTNAPLYALETIDGSLFCGGSFTTIADDSISFLAMWATSSKRSALAPLATAPENNSFMIYPNPVQDELWFKASVNSEKIKTYNFMLTDVLGNNVITVTDIRELFHLQRDRITAGVYFYRITTSDNVEVQKGKLIFK